MQFSTIPRRPLRKESYLTAGDTVSMYEALTIGRFELGLMRSFPTMIAIMSPIFVFAGNISHLVKSKVGDLSRG